MYKTSAKTCFTSSKNKVVPIHLIKATAYSSWHKKQTAAVKTWLKSSDFKAEAGLWCRIPDKEGHTSSVIVIVGKDGPSMWTLSELPKQLPAGSYALKDVTKEHDRRILCLGWALGAYQFDHYKTSRDNESKIAKLWLDKADAVWVGALAEGHYLVRDLIQTPAGDLGPKELSDVTKSALSSRGAKVVLTQGKTLEKNYPAVHTVGMGSDRAPVMVEATWAPKAKKSKDLPLIALIGKGVCFDTGGLDIKPAAGMRFMKKDMGGAAHTLALANMIIDLELPVRLYIGIPCVENAVSGKAMRPMDVIKTRSGQTVEIGDTDAEGRLILCDALTAATEHKPDMIIDCATLTGAARVALGAEVPPFFTHDDKVSGQLMKAADHMEDPLWRLPLWPSYRRHLKSSVADLSSISNVPLGGAITAALFLSAFVPDNIPWIHVDMMGWNPEGLPGRPAGGELQGARALLQLIQTRYS